MIQVIRSHIVAGAEGLARPALRYALIRRLVTAASSRGVTVLAFGLGEDELRCILEGDAEDVKNVVRGTKSGTCRNVRSWGVTLLWGESDAREIQPERLPMEIAWCHRAGPQTAPLASPWTSHRDLMGYRLAGFLDLGELLERVEPLDVHERAGGGPLPAVLPPEGPRSLAELLRVAAAVVGVLPADRRCFRLFVHVGRLLGWGSADMARALMLTSRRIRQLSQGDEPLVPVALAHLGDARLARVP